MSGNNTPVNTVPYRTQNYQCAAEFEKARQQELFRIVLKAEKQGKNHIVTQQEIDDAIKQEGRKQKRREVYFEEKCFRLLGKAIPYLVALACVLIFYAVAFPNIPGNTALNFKNITKIF